MGAVATVLVAVQMAVAVVPSEGWSTGAMEALQELEAVEAAVVATVMAL